MKIQKELAPMNTEEVNSKSKEENILENFTERKENGKSYSQISQAINSNNLKNPEEIKRKPSTKLLSPIKELKSLSKGIFKNNWKSTIKPVVTIFSVTSESKGSSSKIDKSSLK
ncbi:hypothetical protein O181_082510 [Austropuccinia psidii MF-1]|uniref:Uncharacterized protein n=1 Tax=Austropuccinia psidii MF-1 TaxID=1389203 RepID=A0A9Q3FS03_9BASI|nr:hypothetical protein [Austropuccinia psidii MF-1]